MPATESVNLFNAMATASAVLMGDALDGAPFYLGIGLTLILCGAILKALVSLFKGRKQRFKIKYRKIT